ncbi:MAG: hypothetical protein ACE366_09435 [Bradymonadia bacterium]
MIVSPTALSLTCLAVICLHPLSGEARGRLRLESGPAVDTNVTRIEEGQGDSISSGLLRVIGVLQSQEKLAPGASIYGQYQGGGKRFFDRPEEDVLLQRLTVGAGTRLTPKGAVSVGGAVSLRDRSTRDPFLPRDYLRTSAEVGPSFRWGAWQLVTRGTVERFYFKPNAAQSTEGFGGRGALSTRWGSVRLALSGSALTRRFEGPRLRGEQTVGGVPVISAVAGSSRQDTLSTLSAQLQYVGNSVGQVRYTLVDNASNSFGGGLVQHRFELSGTTSLPWSLIASLAVGVQHVRYDNTVAVSAENSAPTVLLDDENRSSVTFRVLRPITGPWGISAHGGFWFSPFASDQPFSRQVLGLSLAYQDQL